MKLNHIYQGDCLEQLKLIPTESVDCVITDPPYGIGINKMGFVKSGAIKVKGSMAYRNDYTNRPTGWDENGLTEEYFREIQRVSKNQIIFGGNYLSNIFPQSNCWVVWDKKKHKKYSNDFADCELIWTSFNKPSRMIRFLWSGMLQEDMKYKEKRYHPTQKPVKIMEQLLKMFTKENDLILDPFCGVGSTCIACIKNNRKFIGIELSEEYIKIANKRLDPWINQTRLI